jgi:hypothetical protein
MTKKDQFGLLNQNYDELEDDKKDTLLSIGENLLNIQSLVNKEKLESVKPEKKSLRLKH